MKVGAIICEYNPLHNGHAYHIAETKKSGVTHLIAVLSDDFVQRGTPALLGKYDRAELAIQAGADLVIELPVPYACASAEFYARGAVSLLHELNLTDVLSFGCSGSPDQLYALAEVSGRLAETHPEHIRKLMKAGNTYPSAVFQIISAESPELGKLLLDPNNLLAVEYLKSMNRLHVRFSACPVRREQILHDSQQTAGRFASASLIRQMFASQDTAYPAYIPEYTADMLSVRAEEGRIADIAHLEKIILYRMRTISEAELHTLPDMTDSLMGRFLKARNASSLDAFLNTVSTRCFTMARIRRILLSALIHIRKEDLTLPVPYARILACNRNGTELLKLARSTSHIPVGTSLARLRKTSPAAERFAELETYTADLYGLAQETICSAEQEFRKKIQITQK